MAFSKRKHNQGTGLSSTTFRVGCGFNSILRSMANKLPPEPKVPEKIPKPRANIILTDAQVIECRSRYEFEGWPFKRLLQEYSEYGVKESYLRGILNYTNRSKLIPKRPPMPVIKQKDYVELDDKEIQLAIQQYVKATYNREVDGKVNVTVIHDRSGVSVATKARGDLK